MQISPLGGLPLGSYLQCTQDGLSDLSPNRVTACLVNLNLACQVLEYEQTAEGRQAQIRHAFSQRILI